MVVPFGRPLSRPWRNASRTLEVPPRCCPTHIRALFKESPQTPHGRVILANGDKRVFGGEGCFKFPAFACRIAEDEGAARLSSVLTHLYMMKLQDRKSVV